MSNTLDYQQPQPKKRRRWRFLLSMGFFATLFAASIILPYLNKFREEANEKGASMNLHQIGLGILLYSLDRGGQYPDSLATLVVQEHISPNLLIDPATDDTPATGATTQQIVADIARGGHQTFIYLGAGMTEKTADATTLIAYEPLSVYHNGTNALFGDGHGEWLTPAQLHTCLSLKPASMP